MLGMLACLDASEQNKTKETLQNLKKDCVFCPLHEGSGETLPPLCRVFFFKLLVVWFLLDVVKCK